MGVAASVIMLAAVGLWVMPEILRLNNADHSPSGNQMLSAGEQVYTVHGQSNDSPFGFIFPPGGMYNRVFGLPRTGGGEAAMAPPAADYDFVLNDMMTEAAGISPPLTTAPMQSQRPAQEMSEPASMPQEPSGFVPRVSAEISLTPPADWQQVYANFDFDTAIFIFENRLQSSVHVTVEMLFEDDNFPGLTPVQINDIIAFMKTESTYSMLIYIHEYLRFTLTTQQDSRYLTTLARYFTAAN